MVFGKDKVINDLTFEVKHGKTFGHLVTSQRIKIFAHLKTRFRTLRLCWVWINPQLFQLLKFA